MTDHTRDVTLTLFGVDVTFTVAFYIESYPTSDSFMEPGDAGSIVIDAVYQGEDDVYAWAEKTHYSWNFRFVRSQFPRGSVSRMRTALFGEVWYLFDKIDGKFTRRPGGLMPTRMYVHHTRQTVLEALEAEIIENLNDYVNDEPDYDYSY